MAATTTPASVGTTQPKRRAPVPFDFTAPPVIEGFTPPTRLEREGFKQKTLRKFKENPIVPIGCFGTAGVLACGLQAFHEGKKRKSQLLMRGRVMAQGFTMFALIIGVFFTALKTKK